MKNSTTEQARLDATNAGSENWRRWGPYLSERQWGTVREDYSPQGNAWDYFPHDHARSRVYRWGEDGIAGLSDDQCRLCLSLALWNGKDPILKERFFGLTNSEGNHGEDVKELYYYLDATPTHSYLKMLYKYPQREFPYAQLVAENARRKGDSRQPEFELLDTGSFDDDRYWDVFVEYAKAAPDDILMRVTVHNRGPDEATIHLLPQFWFRNTWAWKANGAKPMMRGQNGSIVAQREELGEYVLHSDPLISTGLQPGDKTPQGKNRLNGFSNDAPSNTRLKPGANERPEVLFCDNETNVRRRYGQADTKGFFKDAFHEYLVHGNCDAVNPAQTGTKAGVLYRLTVNAGQSAQIRVRLAKVGQASRLPGERANASGRAKNQADSLRATRAGETPELLFTDFASIFSARICEADEFYTALQQDINDADARNVQRQAFAGMIWSKQFFYYDVPEWIKGDPEQPAPPAERKSGRNREWLHLNNADILSMPDKW